MDSTEVVVEFQLSVSVRAVPDWRDFLSGLAYRQGFDGHDIRVWENRGVPAGVLVLRDADPGAFSVEGIAALRRGYESAADGLLRDVRRTRALARLDEFEAFRARVEAAGVEMRARHRALRAASSTAEALERAGALAEAAERVMSVIRAIPGFDG